MNMFINPLQSSQRTVLKSQVYQSQSSNGLGSVVVRHHDLKGLLQPK